MSSQHDAQDRVIGQRYRLEEIVGAGGMATVWRATDLQLQRRVAIKVLTDALADDAATRRRFQLEARIHRGLRHRNVVRVHADRTASAPPHLVMDYVAGPTLSELLDGDGIATPGVERLALDLLEAIASVHDHGFLHRDIKPANVLLDHGTGGARLIDFGLACPQGQGRDAQAETVVGTLRYLAPELLAGDCPTPQSDLFALGALLGVAVGARDLPGTRARAFRQTPLHDLIGRLTARDPAARPATAAAALALLPAPPQTRLRTAGSSA